MLIVIGELLALGKGGKLIEISPTLIEPLELPPPEAPPRPPPNNPPTPPSPPRASSTNPPPILPNKSPNIFRPFFCINFYPRISFNSFSYFRSGFFNAFLIRFLDRNFYLLIYSSNIIITIYILTII